MDQLPYKNLCRGALIANLFCIPHARAACIADPVTTVPVTMEGPEAYIPVSINGSQGFFLVDTGAEQTLLDAAYAGRAGAGMDQHAGRMVFTGAGNKDTLPVSMGHVRQTKIGDITFPDWEYAMLDMSAVLPASANATGLLGMDFLHYFDLEFDFTKNALSIYRMHNCTEMQPPGWSGDYDAIPLKHLSRSRFSIPIYLDGAYLNVQFDTGAGSLLITRDAAARAGANAEALSHDPQTHAGGIGGRFNAVRHKFKLLLVGSGVYPDPTIAVEDEYTNSRETDGLIGLRAFQAKRIWVSFATGTLFVQGAPKKP